MVRAALCGGLRARRLVAVAIDDEEIALLVVEDARRMSPRHTRRSGDPAFLMSMPFRVATSAMRMHLVSSMLSQMCFASMLKPPAIVLFSLIFVFVLMSSTNVSHTSSQSSLSAHEVGMWML